MVKDGDDKRTQESNLVQCDSFGAALKTRCTFSVFLHNTKLESGEH